MTEFMKLAGRVLHSPHGWQLLSQGPIGFFVGVFGGIRFLEVRCCANNGT